MNKKEKIKREIEKKYTDFPIELLDLVAEYVRCNVSENCKTMGLLINSVISYYFILAII